MLQLWWNSLRWIATAGVMIWFFALPLAPIYGLLRPRPRAEEGLKQGGITGFPLMIGAASQGERHIDSSGEQWRTEKQRSFIVLPESLRRFEIFTYSELEGSSITGVQKTVVRSSSVSLVVFWVLAGAFTLWQARRWTVKKASNPAHSVSAQRETGRLLNKP